MTTENKISAKADFLSALVWMAFGLAVVIASWRMDRLESQGASLYTAPGLVPGVLGAVLLLLGMLLAVRAARAGGYRLDAKSLRLMWGTRSVVTRVGGVLVLGIGYAAGLLGHGGIPFWLATFLFVTLFILLFDWRARVAKRETAKGVLLAVVYGASTAFVVSYVFQELFLVRLP